MRIFFSAMIAVIGLHLIDNAPFNDDMQLYVGTTLSLVGAGLAIIFAFADWADSKDD